MDIAKYKDHAESFIKLFTISLGTFYVLGIIIQSTANDSLGLPSDYFLQVRSVMTGISFLIYFVLFFTPFLALIISLFILFSPILFKKLAAFNNYFFLPATLLIPYLAGIYIGFMTPWGRTLDESNLFSRSAWSWAFTKGDILASYDNLLFAYGHPKVKLCYFFLFILFVLQYVVNSDMRNGIMQKIKDLFFPKTPVFKGLMIGINIGIIPLLLITYAVEIYPNVRGNLGGGQPNIVELTISNSDSLHPGLHRSRNILWKQSEPFTYLSPLDSFATNRTQLIAVKTSSIEDIRYLKGYVKLVSGNEISSFVIHEK